MLLNEKDSPSYGLCEWRGLLGCNEEWLDLGKAQHAVFVSSYPFVMTLSSSLCLSFSPYPIHSSSNSIFPPCRFVVNTAFSLWGFPLCQESILSLFLSHFPAPSCSLPWRKPGVRGCRLCVDLYSVSSLKRYWHFFFPLGVCAWQGNTCEPDPELGLCFPWQT